MKKDNCVQYKYIPPGFFTDLKIVSDGVYLTELSFYGFDKDFNNLPDVRTLDASSLPKVVKDTVRWLDIYFTGKDPGFIPKMKLESLTSFQARVIEIMLKIPFGQSITYGDIAKQIAKERGLKKMSAQAVGQAVGSNPICIIVPCHRVLGAKGKITGYGGGIINKAMLLELEDIPYEN